MKKIFFIIAGILLFFPALIFILINPSLMVLSIGAVVAIPFVLIIRAIARKIEHDHKRICFSIASYVVLIVAFFMTIGHEFLCPVIRHGDFPFVIVYELDGEIIRLEGYVLVRYERRNNVKTSGTHRYWRTNRPNMTILEQRDEPSAINPERMNRTANLRIRINGAYLMGDRRRVFTHGGEPAFFLHEMYEWHRTPSGREGIYTVGIRGAYYVLDAQQLREYFGIELIQFDFAPPIRNRFSLFQRLRTAGWF